MARNTSSIPPARSVKRCVVVREYTRSDALKNEPVEEATSGAVSCSPSSWLLETFCADARAPEARAGVVAATAEVEFRAGVVVRCEAARATVGGGVLVRASCRYLETRAFTSAGLAVFAGLFAKSVGATSVSTAPVAAAG